MLENNEQSPDPNQGPTGTHAFVSPVSAESLQVEKERSAFSRHVQEQGTAIPPNFKTADDWFSSLVEARSQFTKARQEISSLKKQYNQGTTNPNYKEPVVTDTVVKEVQPQDLSGIPDELKIQSAIVPPSLPSTVTQNDWVKWGAEMDKVGGLSEATKKEIKAKMGADDVVVNQMILGQQALRKESFNKAASVVGGGDNLKALFKWAHETLPADEVTSLNRALQSPAYSSVLLGLQARKSAVTPQPPVNKEPKVVLERVNNSQVPSQVQVFDSMAAQNAALSDPRFRVDPSFRQAVERMMVNSSKHGFKVR